GEREERQPAQGNGQRHKQAREPLRVADLGVLETKANLKMILPSDSSDFADRSSLTQPPHVPWAILHIAIQRRAPDMEHVAYLLHRHRLFGIQFARECHLLRMTRLNRRPASQPAARSCRLQPGGGALSDDLALEFG